MTSQATITRHYSGFSNVSDTFRVGNFEHEGRASVDDYDLPNGYEVDGLVVRDPDGYQCEIVLHSSGAPQLISLAGKIQTSPVLRKYRANHPNRRQPKFRSDNTEGYDAAQLVELNRLYDERIATYDSQAQADKSVRDQVAERVQADFDAR